MNLAKLTKHEMCMAMAAWGSEAAPNTEPFTSEYENWYEDWLVSYVFVKMLGPTEALYLMAVHDDEGPNPYEGTCADFAHLCVVNGAVTFKWGQWPPAM